MFNDLNAVVSWELIGIGVLVAVVGIIWWRRRAAKIQKDASKTPDEIYPLW